MKLKLYCPEISRPNIGVLVYSELWMVKVQFNLLDNKVVNHDYKKFMKMNSMNHKAELVAYAD